MAELTDIDAERTVVTSALPYIHGVPHLGNIVGSLLPADLYHRFLDLRGHDNIYICGSDEHGTPLELSAMEAGEEPKVHADRQHETVKDVLERFRMDFSLYGRTHTPHNEEQTLDIFRNLYRNGYIVEKSQTLPYCTNDERFLPDRYIEGECPECGGLARGDQCDDCGTLLEPEEIIDPYCTICEQSTIEFRDTDNLFLQLGKFEDDLREWLEERAPIPDNRMEEVLNLIDDGLEDRCITRDIDWGFRVPTELDGIDPEVYDDKVLYVWFDAPIGYIGITRQFLAERSTEERWRDYWQDPDARTVYSIGKDNTIFHSIIFPSMLMGGAEEGRRYNLPDYEFIHQYLLSDEVQFSKSRGTGLSSEDALDMLDADYWRFYLARVIPEAHDTSFSFEDLEARINGELNDTVGNFVNRVLTLADNWFDGEVPGADLDRFEEDLARLDTLVCRYDRAFEEEKSPKRALERAMEVARLGDEVLSREEPWNNPDARDDTIRFALRVVRAISVLFYPFTPRAAERTAAMLDDGEVVTGADRLAELLDPDAALEPGHGLGEREILFEQVDGEELAARVEGEEDDEGNDAMTDDTISFEEFQDLDLRIGTIEDVDDHPNADRLYLLTIDVGGETKQSCAGLKPHFAKEELVGRTVVVLNNLETAELRGEKSEVMVLAADDGDEVVLLEPAEDVPVGTEIR